MLVRVSNLESFRRWREDEDKSVEDFLASLVMQPTTAMMAGTAFHAGLEEAVVGESGIILAEGYQFDLNIDAELSLPFLREIRCSKSYGPITVTGKFDAMDGKTIIDHKTTARFNAERYVEGYQWRYYLDIFEADTFRWNVFEIREVEPRHYDVFAYHPLEQSRYPGLHDDCSKLALEFHDFMRRVAPEYQPRLETA